MRSAAQVLVCDWRNHDGFKLLPRGRRLRFRFGIRSDGLDPIPERLLQIARRIEVRAVSVRRKRHERRGGNLARRRTVDAVFRRPGEVCPCEPHTVDGRLGGDELRRERGECRGHVLRDIGRHRNRILHRLPGIARPVLELIAVIGNSSKRNLRAERMRARAIDVSVSVYLCVDIHEDARRLRDGVDFARNDDSAGARDPRIVVRVGEAHRSAARAGVVTLLNSDPRFGADRVPNIVYSGGDADLSCAGVA